MMSILLSGCIQGLRAHVVQVEVDLQSGLPSFCIVGLPDTSIRESKERVRSAFKNSNLSFPMKRITVNLAPAHIKKEGSSFELAIALGLFMADQKWDSQNFKKILFLGELSLQGNVNTIRGILPLVLAAQKSGIKKIFVPKDNMHEAAMGAGSMEIYGLDCLKQAIQVLKQEEVILPAEVEHAHFIKTKEINFSDVKGQVWAKRALEIAAAGGHNILMMGPPGCGKSMLAKRFPSILPPLSLRESLEVTQIYSISGFLNEDEYWVYERPFRSPHHTASYSALVGGGYGALMPGEITLAHRGVLFLDEMAEFRRDVLETLREPLEEGKISISRVEGRFIYPANFLLIGAMNPCPCGFWGHPKKECICSEQHIRNYKNKISGALMDRIDLHVMVSSLSPEEMPQFIGKVQEENSQHILERVQAARKRQEKRFQKRCFLTNTHMTPKAISEFCILESQAEKTLNEAMEKFGLSYRTYHRILKVSRTIADLENEEKIRMPHIAQAIQLRFLDR